MSMPSVSGFPRFGSAHPNGLAGAMCENATCRIPAASLVWIKVSPQFERDVHLRLCPRCTVAAKKNAPNILELATTRDTERSNWVAARPEGGAAGPKGGQRAKRKTAVADVLAGERFSS